MLRACLLAFAFLVAAVTIAPAAESDPVPPDVREKIVSYAGKEAKRRATLQTEVEAKTELLKNAKVGVIDGTKKDVVVPEKPDKKNPVRFPSAQAKTAFLFKADADLKKAKGDLGDLGKTNYDLIPPFTELKVGQFFSHGSPKIKCDTVVDKTSAVLVMFPQDGTVAKPKRTEVYVTGVDTSGWADDLSVPAPAGVYVVIGNKKVKGTTYIHLALMKFTDDEAKEIAKAAKP